jgi:hypothetical protein
MLLPTLLIVLASLLWLLLDCLMVAIGFSVGYFGVYRIN